MKKCLSLILFLCGICTMYGQIDVICSADSVSVGDTIEIVYQNDQLNATNFSLESAHHKVIDMNFGSREVSCKIVIQQAGKSIIEPASMQLGQQIILSDSVAIFAVGNTMKASMKRPHQAKLQPAALTSKQKKDLLKKMKEN